MKNDTLRIIGACTVGFFALVGVGYVVTKKLVSSKTYYCHNEEVMLKNSNEHENETHEEGTKKCRVKRKKSCETKCVKEG